LQYRVFLHLFQIHRRKSTIAGGDSRQEVTIILNPTNLAGDRGPSAFDGRQNFGFTTTGDIRTDTLQHAKRVLRSVCSCQTNRTISVSALWEAARQCGWCGKSRPSYSCSPRIRCTRLYRGLLGCDLLIIPKKQ
jgi:hypothetical protein